MTWELKKVIMKMYENKYKHVFVEDASKLRLVIQVFLQDRLYSCINGFKLNEKKEGMTIRISQMVNIAANLSVFVRIVLDKKTINIL